MSKASNALHRKSIRETWGKQHSGNVRIETVFFIGDNSTDLKIRTNILTEDDVYHDVIMMNLNDDDKYSAVKILAALKWVEKCRNAAYVMKVQDNTYVNIENVIALIQNAPYTDFYAGDVRIEKRIERSNRLRHFFPVDFWSHYWLPPYCSGSVYILSGDVVKKVNEISQDILVLIWDDVFMGIILNQLHISPFPLLYADTDNVQVYTSRCAILNTLVTTALSPYTMYDYQTAKQNISSPNGTKCQHFQKYNHTNLSVTDVYSDPVSNKVYNMKNSVISAPSSCQNGVDPIQLIILVFTHPVNYRNRMVARLAWKRSRPFSDRQIVVKFVMGRSEDKNINEVIDKESILYNDVIKVDLIDKLENEPLKHLLAFKWTAHYCPSYFVMKILDNVFISSGNLVDYLSSITTKSEFVACPKVIKGSKPIREKGNTWYVSEEEWQSENYPPYCANAMFIMSMDVTKSVVEHLSGNQLFRFTDIQLGDIHEKIGITPIEDEKLSHHQLRANKIDTLLDDFCTSSLSQSVFTNFNDIVREGILKVFLADSHPNCTKKISESATYRNHVSFPRTVGTHSGSTKFQYILNTPDRCLRHRKSLHLFIMIMTKPENENFRTQIRSTWASQTALQSLGVDY
ncbi:uncharacterized protein LOC144439981 [Glandiceps talaboti]